MQQPVPLYPDARIRASGIFMLPASTRLEYPPEVANKRRMRYTRPVTDPMSKIISDYQKWKQQGKDLQSQASQAMETRFSELLSEAVQLAEEYRADFGAALKPPSNVTAFRYKAGPKPKAKKAPAKPVAAEPQPEPVPGMPARKLAGLQKRLATAQRKLEEAKAAGAPTRDWEDKIYEIEDELHPAAAQ
jgi:hypothetical protein